MPPASNTGISALKDMRNRLNAAMVSPGKYREEFLPESVLKNLVDPETVAAVLKNSPEAVGLTAQADYLMLAEYFGRKAPKVFAILARNRLLDHMEYLCEKRVLDKMLPINLTWRNYSRDEWDVEPYYDNVEYEGDIREVFGCDDADSPWEDHTIELFFEGQWPFVPACFEKDRFMYNFPEQTRLPFTRTGIDMNPNSLFSWVEERSVHAEYFPNDLKFSVAVDNDNNPRVAIKKLQKSGSFEKVAEQEAHILEKIRNLKTEHLIKAIAYYQIGQDHYFMLPWAEGGNLWDFWQRNEKHASISDKEKFLWMFTQLAGLAEAVEELHLQNCRHGDLKPSNILCFMTQSEEHKPRLVITDVGAARAHKDRTELRDSTVEFGAVTAAYQAPESFTYPHRARSRRFDVWSLGCIFLEFAVWALYGLDQLILFRRCTETFYRINTATNGTLIAGLHPEVEKLIAYVRQDWRCSEGTATRQFIDLIQNRMLKVELDSRADAQAIKDNMNDILQQLTRDDKPIEALGVRPENSAQISPGPFGPTKISI